MSNLFRTGKGLPQPVQGLNVQSSVYGKAIPINYGTTKVSGNLILYGNFQSISQSSGGGGKGALFGGASGTSYDYKAAFAFALGEGPIQGIGTVWVGQNLHTLAGKGFTLFIGTYPQTAWATTVSWSVEDENGRQVSGTSSPLGYNGINYVANPAYDLGSATSIPNLQFEVEGIFSTVDQPDASPADVLPDFLTNGHYGLGFPSALINDLTTWRNYCAAFGLLISPSYNSQTNASAMIDDLMTATNSAVFMSNGLLSVTPYGDQAVTVGAVLTATEMDIIPAPISGKNGGYPTIKVSNAATFVANVSVTNTNTASPFVQVAQLSKIENSGQYYVDNQGNYYFRKSDQGTEVTIVYTWAANAAFTPNLTPVVSLGDDDYMRTPQNNIGASASAGSAGPLLMTRKRKSDRINSVKVEYLDRASGYNPSIAYAENQAEIDAYGKRTNGTKSLHLFALASAANLSAQLQLRRQLVNNTYSFDLDSRYAFLECMDVIAISDTNLGLSSQLVRITGIQENDDLTLSFTCEDILEGSGQSPLYTFGQQQGQPVVNFNSDPGNVSAVTFFEPTFELNGDLEVWVAFCGGSNWGGAQAWISTDDINYTLADVFAGGARMGVLTATLPSVTEQVTGQTIDQTNTLSIDLTESSGTLSNASQQQATSLSSLIWVDGEIMAFGTATLITGFQYNLTYLVRGAYNSTISSHASGSNFVRLDGQGILKIPFTQDRIGQTIYLKFLSFNIYGGGLQTLGDVSPFSYLIQGSALAEPLADVTNFAEVFVGNLAELNWTEITDFRAVLYEIRVGTSWNNGQTLVRQAHPPFRVMGDGTYWIKAFSQPAAGLNVYSNDAASVQVIGSKVNDNLFASREEDPNWTGTLTGAILKVGTTLQTNGLGGGTYQIPTGDRIVITYPTPCAVLMKWTSIGQPLNNSIFIYKGVANIISGSTVINGMKSYSGNAILQGNTTLIGISNTTNFSPGDPVTGTGISSGCEILSVLSSVSASITVAATLGSTTSGSTQAITVYPQLQVGQMLNGSTTLLAPSSLSSDNAITAIYSSDMSQVSIQTAPIGNSTTSTIQASIDIMQTADLFGAAAIGNVSAYPFIRTSQDGGITWSTFQRWVAGYYNGNAFDAEMFLQTVDVNSVGVIETFQFSVDVPDRVDHYPSFAISSLGSTLVFRPDASVTSTLTGGSSAAFNGGQNASTSVTVLAGGSTVNFFGTIQASNISLGSCLLNAYSSAGTAIGVSANVVVEGY